MKTLPTKPPPRTPDDKYLPYLTAWLVVACIVGVGITAFIAWVVS